MPSSQVASALAACSLGIIMALMLVSARAPAHGQRVGLLQQMLIPMRPPSMDHNPLGVGNEEASDANAVWALKALGLTNGTLLEALINNGTIAHEGEAIDPSLVAEIHAAQHQQALETDPNAPEPQVFPFVSPRCPPSP